MSESQTKGTVRQVVDGLALLLVWLIALGLPLSEGGALAVATVLLVPVVFSWLHVHRESRPARSARLRGFYWGDVLRLGVPASVLFVLGDILWIISRDQLDLEATAAPIPEILAIALLFPLIEEFGFRLWVQTPLEDRLGSVGAIATVALIFSLFHSAEFPLPQFLAGVGYGIALVATQSIWAPVFLHVLQNTTILVAERIPGVESSAIGLAESEAPWILPVVAVAWTLGLALVCTWFVRANRQRGTARSAAV